MVRKGSWTRFLRNQNQGQAEAPLDPGSGELQTQPPGDESGAGEEGSPPKTVQDGAGPGVPQRESHLGPRWTDWAEWWSQRSPPGTGAGRRGSVRRPLLSPACHGQVHPRERWLPLF